MFDTIIAEMKNVRTITKRRAVSPVIATVVLVAVTITVAVAVAYWMSGITGQYTQFEKVEIQNAICVPEDGGWVIDLKLKNSGTKTATLTDVFVNDAIASYAASVPGYFGIVASLDSAMPVSILSGASTTVTVHIKADLNYLPLSAGTTINIKIHSAGGMDYIRLVQLN